MAIIVVDETEGVVVILRGKAEGVFKVEVASRNGGGVDCSGDRAEGGVVVVSSDAIARFKVDEFRDVLIAIKGIEELVASWIGKHKERACRYRFGWSPNEKVYLRVVVSKAMVFSHAKPLRQFCL